MSKHTKGPWFSGPKCEISGWVNIYSIEDDGFESLPFAACKHHDQEANARLIAAAPELLEALKAAIDCGMVPITSASEGGASKHSRQVQVADTIRAAIAKAEGTA